MSKRPETRKSGAEYLVLKKCPENIGRKEDWRWPMTRNEMDDQPTIPPLQGADNCWSWRGGEFWENNKPAFAKASAYAVLWRDKTAWRTSCGGVA